jgi:hypothetical protein
MLEARHLSSDHLFRDRRRDSARGRERENVFDPRRVTGSRRTAVPRQRGGCHLILILCLRNTTQIPGKGGCQKTQKNFREKRTQEKIRTGSKKRPGLNLGTPAKDLDEFVPQAQTSPHQGRGLLSDHAKQRERFSS